MQSCVLVEKLWYLVILESQMVRFLVFLVSSSLLFGVESHDIFGVKHWPVVSGGVRKHLLNYTRKGSCQPNPLPAFNQDGRLLVPCEYRPQLKGSLVAIQVVFFHILDETCNVGCMFAEVDHIEIICAPLPLEKSFTSVRMPYEQYEANLEYRQ